MVYSLYYYLVTNYANVGMLTEIVWSSQVSVCLSLKCCFSRCIDHRTRAARGIGWSVHYLCAASVIFPYQLIYHDSCHGDDLVSRGRSKALPIIVSVVVVVLSSGVSIGKSSTVLFFFLLKNLTDGSCYLGNVSEKMYSLTPQKMLIGSRYQVRVETDLIRIVWSSYMYLGTIASVDIVIAASLWYLLATSLTGFSK
ncbi:hypothetical protein AZE42_05631 [Rhizopogon vesiculosus]|uniref:Uncharacterized protein n=1 Tax=Rhizopogon vesiculosus TaxID=180088 RepID=A0A1J8QH64_9AGAM|nr:hypothetical protein AZE42_05631 [Rhizopogon vesiculosus]